MILKEKTINMVEVKKTMNYDRIIERFKQKNPHLLPKFGECRTRIVHKRTCKFHLDFGECNCRADVYFIDTVGNQWKIKGNGEVISLRSSRNK